MKICSYCGVEFNPDEVGRRKYCSEECANKAKKDNFKRYWETNKEKHQKTCREYQLEHREERDRRVQEFFQRHPEKHNEYKKKYRDRKKNKD